MSTGGGGAGAAGGARGIAGVTGVSTTGIPAHCLMVAGARASGRSSVLAQLACGDHTLLDRWNVRTSGEYLHDYNLAVRTHSTDSTDSIHRTHSTHSTHRTYGNQNGESRYGGLQSCIQQARLGFKRFATERSLPEFGAIFIDDLNVAFSSSDYVRYVLEHSVIYEHAKAGRIRLDNLYLAASCSDHKSNKNARILRHFPVVHLRPSSLVDIFATKLYTACPGFEPSIICHDLINLAFSTFNLFASNLELQKGGVIKKSNLDYLSPANDLLHSVLKARTPANFANHIGTTQTLYQVLSD